MLMLHAGSGERSLPASWRAIALAPRIARNLPQFPRFDGIAKDCDDVTLPKVRRSTHLAEHQHLAEILFGIIVEERKKEKEKGYADSLL